MAGSLLPPVLVAGDVFVDHLLYAGHDNPGTRPRGTGALVNEWPGGAALLAGLLRHLLYPGRRVDLATDPASQADWPRAYGLFDRYDANPFGPKKDKDDDRRPKVWRLREAQGYGEPPRVAAPPSRAAAADAPGVVVLDDAGFSFCREASRYAWPVAVRDPAKAPPGWIVLNARVPLAAGDLWHHLASDGRRLLRRTVAVASAAELQAEHVRVVTGLSWERAALDIAEGFNRHPALAGLRQCRYVVVRLGTDGAVLADFPDDGPPVFRLLFDPAHLDGDWAAKVPGGAYGYQTTFAAGVAAAVARLPAPGDEARTRLEVGIAAALAATRRLVLAGHGPAAQEPTGGLGPAFPSAALVYEYRMYRLRCAAGRPLTAASRARVEAYVKRYRQHFGEHGQLPCTYEVTTVPYEATTSPAGVRAWSIAASGPSGTPLFGLARRVALSGPAALKGLPLQRYGKLVIVDRGEIESLRGLRRMIVDYAKSKPTPPVKPLSIAAFGAPGAGKSLGVKELSKAIFDEKVPILDFNLSQFEDPEALVGMFHQVRDKVLEGHLPVVFWDEFDSQKLKWLQYLLAPMQDGKFQEGQITHPIGKCLFVFAGGTCHEFAAFGPPAGPNATPAEQAAWLHFSDRKGPDFKSRLSGYLNVLGPNPRRPADERDDPRDVTFPVRRALQLRANLELGQDERLKMDRGVLSAFLEVARYEHGARSLETLLRQTRAAAGGGPIGRSHLPPRDLLALHADADEFLAIVERDLAFQIDVEVMADAYHEYYRQQFPPKPGELTDRPYGRLDEFLKDDNRAAARRICDVLAMAGLYVVPADEVPPAARRFDALPLLRQNMELLAEAEHDGWMDSRARNGWLRGPRSLERREHDRMVPYAELDEATKEKDRQAVLRYPDIVARANYRIVPRPLP